MGHHGLGNTGKLSPGSQDERDKTSARPAGRTAGSGRVPSLPGLPHSPTVSKAGPGHPGSLHAPWPLPKQVCAAPNTMRRAPLLRVRFSGCTAETGPPRASWAKRPGSLGHRCACTECQADQHLNATHLTCPSAPKTLGRGQAACQATSP